MAIPAGMGEAERAAYRRAQVFIAKAAREGASQVSFDRQEFRDLTHIPPELSEVTGLIELDLDSTKVSDLSPIRDMAGLEILTLNRTRVSDLSPIRGLTGLRSLSLNETGVSDLSPIRGLTGLRTLSFERSRVSDLSPIHDLTGLLYLSVGQTGVSDLSPMRGLKRLERLLLNQTGVSDLSPIRGLTGLRSLTLNQTGVSDLSPIRYLTGLQALTVDQTGVSDLSPIRDLTELELLSLNQTGVSDLSPIRDLSGLQSLALIQTRVSDLRPILALNKLGLTNYSGLWLSGTAAVQLDERLARLAEIKDPTERAEEVLAYLKTLPPWPEPLPWLPPPPVPQGQPAPLQVIVQDGILRPWMPDDGLSGSAQDLARQGWEALRDYLADLATLRARLTNHIPNLDRALARLESALGARFEEANAIAIGTHGQRVIRLAHATDDSGMAADDVAELQAFAAALALFLERFPEWRSYRDSAAVRPVDPAKLRETLPQIAEVESELFDRLGIDPEVPRKLTDLRNLSAEAPDDPVAANGLLDSFGNILSALADTLIKAAKNAGLGLLGFAKTAAVKGAQKVGEKIYEAATWAAVDILLTKGFVLKQIATNFPDAFGWIIPLLKALGL